MSTHTAPVGAFRERLASKRESRVYSEGITGGLVGAATIAAWFFLLDAVNGRPFHTPMVLGSAIFNQHGGISRAGNLPIFFETVIMYTWIHALVFCAIGGIAARLIALAEADARLGFGIVLLFVVFELGFVALAFVFAEPVLHALTWPAILVGNLLAAGAMTSYFWQRHPSLVIRP